MKYYNYNLSPYTNVKNNFLATRMAQNRWGNRFKELYVKYKDDENRFDFTQGMRSCVGTDIASIVEELEGLQENFSRFFEMTEDSDASENSYVAILCRKSYYEDENEDRVYYPIVEDVKISLSLPVSFSEEDNRKSSIFFQLENKNRDAQSWLEPVNSYYDRKSVVDGRLSKSYASVNRLLLFDEVGEKYGHIDDKAILKDGTTFNNIFSMYGVEDLDNTLLIEDRDYSSLFSSLFDTYFLKKWLIKFVEYSLVWEEHYENNDYINVVFGAKHILFWIHEVLSTWYAYLAELDEEREGDELKLIDHLNLCSTLQDEIGSHSSDIASIWFEFKKDVSPPLIQNKDGIEVYDPNYQWWKEEQFADISKKFGKFYLYFDYIVGSSYSEGGIFEQSYVKIKDDVWSLAGWKIYFIVSSFLKIDSKARSKSFFETLFSFALFALGIFLISISGNPMFLKIILIATAVLSFTGALSPKARLALAILSFVYGAYNADLTSMSSMEMFSYAINNIEMVYKMVQLYDSVKLEEENHKEDENPLLYEEQDKEMQFIYTDAYSQYDDMYSIMYDFDPIYR